MNFFKKIINFEFYDSDWWFFTLLPVVIAIIVSILAFWSFKNTNNALLIITKQLLSYSIILSSTDLSLKFKSSENKRYQIAPTLLLIFIALAVLIQFYTTNPESTTSSFVSITIYLIISVILSYWSVYLYNHNPESITAAIITKSKGEQEKEAEKIFKSPKSKSKDNIKWGK